MQTLNRKKRNIEIERQKKAKHNMQVGIIAAVIFVIVAALAWVVWDTQSRRWVMTFDGERIAASDYRFMLDMFSMFGDDPAARGLAMTELIDALTVINRAERHGVGMTEMEHFSLASDMEMQLQFMQAYYITPGRAAELLGVGPVRGRLMEIYIPDVEIDPILFAQGLIEFIDENADSYESFEVKMVVTGSNEEALRIWATEVEDFDELVREYSIYYNEELGIHTADARELISEFALDDDEAYSIMNMQEGDRHIVQVEDYFVVLYMYDRSPPDLDEMEEDFRANFTETQRFEAFNEIVHGWQDELTITINQRAYNAI